MEYTLLIYGQSSGVSNSDIADILTDLTSLRSLLLRANKNIYALQGELAMANQNICTLQSDGALAYQNIQTLQSQLAVANQNINTLQSDGALANQNIQSLQSQLAVANQDIHSLINQVALDKRDIRFLKQDAANYKKVINKLKYNQTHLSAELKYLREHDAHDGTLTKRSIQEGCGCQMEISNLSQTQSQLKAAMNANTNTNIQMEAEIHDIKGNFSLLRNDQGSLLQSVGDVWKSIRETDAKFVLVNETRKQFYSSSSIIKNNSIAITSLAHKLGTYVNQINSLNATMQHQQHPQEQQTNKLSSSVANLISSGMDNFVLYIRKLLFLSNEYNASAENVFGLRIGGLSFFQKSDLNPEVVRHSGQRKFRKEYVFMLLF